MMREALSIVVCDDNIDAADTLSFLLKGQGYSVITTYSGPDALCLIESAKPHFAVLDIGLPGMTGYEIAKTIRAQSWGKSIVLIAVTGYGFESDKQRAAKAGFNYHFTKPVELDALERLLVECRFTCPEVRTEHVTLSV